MTRPPAKGHATVTKAPCKGAAGFGQGPPQRRPVAMAGCSTVTAREANDAYRRGNRSCVGWLLGANNARRLADQVIA
ncbi:hypothetical protein B296_00050113 [Ensete ventricosum]|uniref:Uncharacterized protein n=1 Tax=Ensete ventricosum TaxID=4639 RepID=A0A426WW31_ENSVE|nr:hypothetical protein B296_00050113 [Ensete ventricosum]